MKNIYFLIFLVLMFLLPSCKQNDKNTRPQGDFKAYYAKFQTQNQTELTNTKNTNHEKK